MAGAVITGIGCITPIAIGVDDFAAALRKGVSGIGPLTLCDPSPYQCRVAAEVRDFKPQEYMPFREARSSPRVVQFALGAARLAMEDAGLTRLPDPTRVGVVLGSSVGPTAYNFEQFAIFLERGVRRMHPSFPAHAHYGVIASECAIQLGIHGPVMCVSSACTSGADAIGFGRAAILGGMADVVLVGGAEAPICPLPYAAFDRLGMMPTHFNDRPQAASRPFSIDREGFVLGEGAAVLVLESSTHAAARGAEVYAEVAGYGATCDADSHFSQAEGGDDAARAIEIALAMAGADPEEVDYVNAHGSATIQNDPFETKVLHRTLGRHAAKVAVSSSKSVLGHLLGASGAVEAAVTAVSMREGFIPPTRNLDEPDPACDLDYVPNEARIAQAKLALSTSFGFGSRNAAVVLRRWQDGRQC
jgi:3-oxoacyl-[acyl-carrier-protein] synthase II